MGWGLSAAAPAMPAVALNGMKACTLDDPAGASNGQALTSGTIYAVQVEVFNPLTAVANCGFNISAGEAGGTAGQNLIGFFSADGTTLLGQTGDLSNAGTTGNWTTAGSNKVTPVAFSLPATPYIWALVLAVFVTTAPSIRCPSSTVGAGFVTSTNIVRAGTLGVGQTALPANFLPANVSNAGALLPLIGLW